MHGTCGRRGTDHNSTNTPSGMQGTGAVGALVRLSFMLYKHKIAAIMRIASLLLEEGTWLERRISLLLSLEIAKSTGDPLAGLQVGELVSFWTRLRLVEDGDEAHFSLEFVGRLELDPRQHLEATLMVLRKIIDLAIEHLSLNYVQSGGFSITDIAFRLGYSDSAHFTRAFRRWTGKSPRQVMKELSARPAQKPVPARV